MTVTPILQKQQSSMPTSMRFERVQSILQNDPAFKKRLSPRTQTIETRYGENLLFSKEVVEVTMAIHHEGRDAHKIPKNDVLRAAMKILKVGANGEARTIVQPESPHTQEQEVTSEPDQPVAPVATKTKTKQTKTAKKPETPAIEQEEPKRDQKTQAAPSTAKKTAKPKPAAKSEGPRPAVAVKTESTTTAKNQAEVEVPESELPPESQPLHLPTAYDPRKYPHYDVQRAIYSMLLSAMSLSEHYEKMPGYEERQKKLESLSKEYLKLCESLNTGS